MVTASPTVSGSERSTSVVCSTRLTPPRRRAAATSNVPDRGASSPAMARSSVDLPEPLGPMRATVRPSGRTNEASARATRGPWASVRSVAVTAAGMELRGVERAGGGPTLSGCGMRTVLGMVVPRAPPPPPRPACPPCRSCLAGCGSDDAAADDGRPTVVVTTSILGDVVEELVGGRRRGRGGDADRAPTPTTSSRRPAR